MQKSTFKIGDWVVVKKIENHPEDEDLKLMVGKVGVIICHSDDYMVQYGKTKWMIEFFHEFYDIPGLVRMPPLMPVDKDLLIKIDPPFGFDIELEKAKKQKQTALSEHAEIVHF